MEILLTTADINDAMDRGERLIEGDYLTCDFCGEWTHSSEGVWLDPDNHTDLAEDAFLCNPCFALTIEP